jgi:hypothetical protein
MFENGAGLLSVQSDIVGLHNQSLMSMYIHVKVRPALYNASSGFFAPYDKYRKLCSEAGVSVPEFSPLNP